MKLNALDRATGPLDHLAGDALASAYEARAAMAATPAHVRATALELAAERVRSDQETFARKIATEGIKTIREARREVERCIATLRLSAAECSAGNGEVLRFDQVPSGEGRTGWWTRRPLGVVLGITPYNDPLNLVAHKIGPAVAAAAPVVVKPHERTFGAAFDLVAAFRGTGLPDGAVQAVEGSGAVAARMASDPRVAVVSFTGGRAAGQALALAAAGKRLLMELGGICSAYVAEDAEPDRAAESLAAGATWAAGQNCVHTQRIFVHRALFDALASSLACRLGKLRIGDQLDERTDIGPLVDEARAIALARQVETALEAGARLLTGGRRSGRHLQPTLLTGVPDGHELASEEAFGPICLIDPVADIGEALDRINRLGPAINVAIFTRRLDHILRFERETDAGAVIVNDSTDFRIDAMPFGGNGAAGLGREGVRSAILAMTEPRVVCLRA